MEGSMMAESDNMQVDMLLENSTAWFKGNKKWTETLGSILSTYETSKPVSTVTHFLQQDHTYSNKTTPTPTRPHLPLVPLPSEAIFFSNHHRELQ